VIGCRNCLGPPPDAGGDRFLGVGMFLPIALGRALDRVSGFDRLDLLGYFGNARPFLFPWLLGRTGKASLELVPQGGQFGQVSIVRERLAQPGLIVAKLRLRDSEVPPDAVAFGAVTIRQPLIGVPVAKVTS
jgi:hypothetical protein